MANPNTKMLKQLQDMQSRIAKVQEDLASVTVTGTAGGGVVTITANGHQQITAVTVQDEALEEGAELLADLVMAAVNDALDRSRAAAGEHMGQLTAGLGLPPGLL